MENVHIPSLIIHGEEDYLDDKFKAVDFKGRYK